MAGEGGLGRLCRWHGIAETPGCSLAHAPLNRRPRSLPPCARQTQGFGQWDLLPDGAALNPDGSAWGLPLRFAVRPCCACCACCDAGGQPAWQVAFAPCPILSRPFVLTRHPAIAPPSPAVCGPPARVLRRLPGGLLLEHRRLPVERGQRPLCDRASGRLRLADAAQIAGELAAAQRPGSGLGLLGWRVRCVRGVGGGGGGGSRAGVQVLGAAGAAGRHLNMPPRLPPLPPSSLHLAFCPLTHISLTEAGEHGQFLEVPWGQAGVRAQRE